MNKNENLPSTNLKLFKIINIMKKYIFHNVLNITWYIK